MFPKDQWTLTDIEVLERSLVLGYRASVKEAALQMIKAGSTGLFMDSKGCANYLVKVARFRRNQTPVAFWTFVEDVMRELRKEDFDPEHPGTWRPNEGNVLQVRASKLPSGRPIDKPVGAWERRTPRRETQP